ncbi:hypothetical protein LPJ66_008797, partial [Kickxella alabastrina]
MFLYRRSIGCISRIPNQAAAISPSSSILIKTHFCSSKHNCAAIGPCAHPLGTPAKKQSNTPAASPTSDLYGTETAIRQDFGYPAEYHAGSFPWLLSAERQRVPVDDLCTHASDPGLLTTTIQWLPLAARRKLAHTLNLRIAERTLGSHAMDSVCAGAAMALPSIARLLSSASSSATPEDTAASLAHVFSAPLLARYTSDLDRLRNDN